MNSPECITERCIAEVIRDAAKAVGYDHHLVRMMVMRQMAKVMAIITQEAIQ